MHILLRVCQKSQFQNLFKARVPTGIYNGAEFKKSAQVFKKSTHVLKSLFRPVKNIKYTLPSSFMIASGIIKFAKCQPSTKPIQTVKVLKQESDQKPFPWMEFFGFLKNYVWWLLGVLVGTIALAFINIQIPLALGEVVNVLVKFIGDASRDVNFFSAISEPVTKLVTLYGLQGLLTTVCISVLLNLGENLASDMKERLFATILVQDVAFFDKNKASDLIHRLTVDIQEFKSAFKLCISQGLKNVVQTTGCVISMMMISPKLTMYLVGLICLLVAGGSLIGSGLRILSRKVQNQSSKSALVAEEAIGNLRTVRAFASEDHEIVHFNKETDKARDLSKILGYGIAVFQGLSNIALNGLVLSTLSVGGLMMSRNELSAGSLMSFLVASQAIQKSLDRLSVMYGISIQGLSAGARAFEFMSLNRGSTLEGQKFIRYHSLHSDISFKDVSFTYPTRKDHPVLEDFSLEIKGGQKVALVGPSGGGKSTVVALLERFYEVDSGSITVDGVDLKDLDPAWLRGRLIGYIGQEPVLFATTIKDNIRYGKPDAQDYEVIEAAKQANAHDFIMSFPEGYNTVLGERGQSVSGGQKQRIAIARALIKNPPVLILDEATSALDVESEKLIQESIDRISKGRTLIIVAHRLSTIKDVDLVAVILNGKIVEVGKPEDLKKKKGVFWNLIKDQH